MSIFSNPGKVLSNTVKNPVKALIQTVAGTVGGVGGLLFGGVGGLIAGAQAGTELGNYAADKITPNKSSSNSAPTAPTPPTQAGTEDTLAGAINANAQKISISTFGGLNQQSGEGNAALNFLGTAKKIKKVTLL